MRLAIRAPHQPAQRQLSDVLLPAPQPEGLLSCQPDAAGLLEGQAQDPEVLLGHYCAILTSLSLSASGRLLATTDR